MARDPRAPGSQISFSRRIGGRVTAATERLDSFKTPLGLAVLAFAAFLAYTAFKATTGPPFLPTYKLTVNIPPDAPPLRRGEAVRVGGSLAGLITKVEPDPESKKTLVEVNISKTKFRPLPVDTQAFVRVKSILYQTYLGLTPGKSSDMLEDGDTLRADADSGTDLLEVVELFDRQAREDLSQTVINVGFGVAGRGTELNGALRDLPATSRYAAEQLRAATKTPGAIRGILVGGAQTTRGLRGQRAGDVAALITGGDRVFGTTARKRDALGRSIELLRPFEDQVLATGPLAESTLGEAAGTAEALGPLLRNLRAQLPGLTELTGLGDELREGFAALLGGGAGGSGGGGVGGSGGGAGGSAGIANQVLAAARPIVYGLFPIQTAVGPLNKSLAQLLATVRPYKPEITQAGQWLQEATKFRSNNGRNPGAPAARVVAVLTPHPCLNGDPDPGAAQKDVANGASC